MSPVYGNTGLCRTHQAVKQPKSKKPIPKVSAKGLVKREAKKELIKDDIKFYFDIWQGVAHICTSCKKQLGDEANMMYFHHMLPKQHYPELRHTPENIMILCPDCHANVESGKMTEEVRRIIEETKNSLLYGSK